MATGGNKTAAGTQVDDGDRVSRQCSICLERYRRPKLLPCFHTFCQSCLEGVAGSSVSFPCPSCRSMVLLPAGGVRALQTNVYIEDDQTSPPQPLCDVCSDDREATHSCIVCKQRYCLPCRKTHDSIPCCRGHSVVALTPGEEACSKEVAEQVEMCPKHPDQRLLLHCSTCQADLCLQCNLTQHEGHPTQDLADIRSKAKDKLKDKLGTLTLELQQIDQVISACEDRCSKLRQQKAVSEQACHARAAMLQQWVDQSLDDAVQTLQRSLEQLFKPWQDRAELLCSRKLSLQAQRDHVLQVLRGGKEADIVALDAQLSSGVMEGVDVKAVTKELTQDLPSFHVEHSPTAVSQLLLRTFIGILEPAQQTEKTSTAVLPQSVPGKVPVNSSVKGSDAKHRAAGKGVGVVGKKPARELIYSQNPKSIVYDMCPISLSRVWVLYKSTDDKRIRCSLKLFDATGRVLITVENALSAGLLSVNDDVLAQIGTPFPPRARLISPDGGKTTCDLGKFNRDSLVSRATNDIHYAWMYEGRGVARGSTRKTLYRIEFTSVSDGHTDSADSDPAGSRPQSQITSPTGIQLTLSVLELVLNNITMYPRHVSAGGRYFAGFSSVCKSVQVYTTAGSQTSFLICSYQTKRQPLDARFCQIDGKEMLLVIFDGDNKVHVIDHTDGGCFIRYLDTGLLDTDRPCCLATDFDQHAWIGCRGGKVVVVDLQPLTVGNEQ